MHVEGIGHPLLVVDRVVLRKDVQDLPVTRYLDAFRRIQDSRDIVLGDPLVLP